MVTEKAKVTASSYGVFQTIADLFLRWITAVVSHFKSVVNSN